MASNDARPRLLLCCRDRARRGLRPSTARSQRRFCALRAQAWSLNANHGRAAKAARTSVCSIHAATAVILTSGPKADKPLTAKSSRPALSMLRTSQGRSRKDRCGVDCGESDRASAQIRVHRPRHHRGGHNRQHGSVAKHNVQPRNLRALSYLDVAFFGHWWLIANRQRRAMTRIATLGAARQ